MRYIFILLLFIGCTNRPLQYQGVYSNCYSEEKNTLKNIKGMNKCLVQREPTIGLRWIF